MHKLIKINIKNDPTIIAEWQNIIVQDFKDIYF